MRLYYQRCLIFCVRAGQEIHVQMPSYASKYASQPLSYRAFFIYSILDTKVENFRLYVDVQHIERMLYYCRYSLCGLELHQRTKWIPTAQDTNQSFSDITLGAYTASLYKDRYSVCNYTWQQNSCTLRVHTTHQMMALRPMMHSFIRTKLSSYTTCCSVFWINCLSNY